MTPSPDKFTGSDEQLWQRTLGQLRTQMTQATYDTWVKGTQIVSRDNGQLVVGTKNPFAKDWLENRLYTTIQRTAANIVGHPVEIQFVIDETISKQTEVATNNDLELLPDDIASLDPKKSRRKHNKSNSAPNKKPDPVATGVSKLAIDIRVLNRTGYNPFPEYYPFFIGPFLDQKWGHAGLRAYLLWEQLAAVDRQYVNSENFQNWSKPVTFTTEELMKMLQVKDQALTGRYGYCSRFGKAHAEGQPLSECCGLHLEHDFQAGKNCRYWRTGVLEILSAEQMMRVEEYGGKKNYRIKIQIWRSWPIRTPYQVKKYFTPQKQEEHELWLKENISVTDLSLAEWTAEPAQDIIEQYPDRGDNMVCQKLYIRNELRLKKQEQQKM